MKKLAIDFAPTSWFRRLYLVHPLAYVLLALGAVGIGYVLWQHAQLQKTLQTIEEKQQRDQARLQSRAEVKAPIVESTLDAQQAKMVNLAIKQLNLPWRDLLQTLEQATPKEIALLTLDPDAKNRTLRVQAESKNSLDMTAYLKKLRQAGLFESVILTRHEVNEQDSNRPLRFQFEARWQQAQLGQNGTQLETAMNAASVADKAGASHE